MEIGMVGLGRMGGSMARRLMRAGHSCVVYDHDPEKVSALARDGARAARTPHELIQMLHHPRVVWVMVPAGDVTFEVIRQFAELLTADDIVVDGGNSHFRDDLVSRTVLGNHGVHFIDCGTSGGIWGEQSGYCLMIGGDRAVAEHLDPIFQSLAPDGVNQSDTNGLKTTAERGYLYCGPTGAGHFVKMIHNGIEYGMMQSFAEGFNLLDSAGHFGYHVPLPAIAEVWRHGSVISSWLLDLAAVALSNSPHLEEFEGRVADSGEGRWTVQAALEMAVPCPVLTESLYARFRSRVDHTFGDKLLSAMRLGFGGHTEQHRTETELLDDDHSRSPQPV